ncbi:MAG: hypothetical protein HPAVJP_4100 [Candidatus Hepatoplasma vulgare]|nr:MAG: hypothetical protein HPAVJP_4100 [Candidatus Hepatoplasma sp.]
MNKKLKLKIKKNFGFVILIISGIIGIAFLLGMLSPFYSQNKNWDYNENFDSDEEIVINGSFMDSNNEMHEINFYDEGDSNNILFVYKDGRKAEFKTTSEYITDLENGNTEGYLFAVPQISITVDLDKNKQKIEVKDNNMEIIDLNENDDINETNVNFSDWNTVYNNKIDESDGFEQRWATDNIISIDTDNKVINIETVNEINEEFTLASDIDGDYGTIYFQSEWYE